MFILADDMGYVNLSDPGEEMVKTLNRVVEEPDMQAVERLGKARDTIVAKLRKTIVGMDEVH